MQDTSGFYILQDGGLGYAPHFVENAYFSLYRENKDSYSYPVNGWYWFESENNARTFFGLPLINQQTTEE